MSLDLVGLITGKAAPGTTNGLVKDNMISLIRSGLIAVGVLLTSLNLFPGEQVDKIIGALITVATVGWILYSNYKNTQTVRAAVQTGQAMPEVQGEVEVTKKLNEGQIVVPTKPEQ